MSFSRRSSAVLFCSLVLAASTLLGQEAKLPRCYLDMTADGEKLGRIVIELRADVVPNWTAPPSVRSGGLSH